MDNLVEVYDFDSNKIYLVSQEKLGSEMIKVNMEGKLYWVNSHQLKQNTFQHPPFTGERKERIIAISRALYEVNPQSYLEWEDGFRRDQHPDNEITIWEHIIRVFLKHSLNEDSAGEKREVYRTAVICSYSEPKVVLTQLTPKYISEDRAKTIIEDYYS